MMSGAKVVALPAVPGGRGSNPTIASGPSVPYRQGCLSRRHEVMTRRVVMDLSVTTIGSA